MRIGIVNDVATAVEALRRALTQHSDYEVVWVARDGAEAVQRAADSPPDLILMDLIMPVMDGVEATRRIMSRTPCAILVVTATVLGHAAKVFEALGAGALDAVTTPVLSFSGNSNGAEALYTKIEQIRSMLVGQARKRPAPALTTFQTETKSDETRDLVAIGASAGGPAALATILSALPQGFPAAVVIVQHLDPRFTTLMANWLGDQSILPVRIAAEGDRLRPGCILVAGKDDHLILREGAILGYTPEPREYVYRPSIDVFFESVVKHWRGKAVGVLLTGMGRDGARGLKSLRNIGSFTIAQNSATCAVYGMPKAAVELGAASEVLPLEGIPQALRHHVETTAGSFTAVARNRKGQIS